LTLKNRLVVPPMVHYRAGPGSTAQLTMCLSAVMRGRLWACFVEATAVEEVGLINELTWHLEMMRKCKASSRDRLMKGRKTAIGNSARPTGGASRPRSGRWTAWARLTPQEIEAGAKCGSLLVPQRASRMDG